ncbi:MAG TPA: hypothetical protein EYG73_08190 [Arcobacter sp.]|nr:hypothetical protein [Arcobacter sp.]
MKISDPIMFGYGFTAFFKDVFAKHQATLDSLNVNPNMGMGDLRKRILGSGDENKLLK